MSDTLAVSTSLPAGLARCVVVAEDRYWFAVALLAAWQVGAEVLFPSSRTEEALRSLRGEWPDALVLTDHERTGELALPERARGASRVERASLHPLPSEQRLATLLTSGTTAASRQWPKTARQLLQEAGLWTGLFPLSARDHVLSTVPPHHVYGLLFGMLVPLAAGASFTRSSVLLPREILRAAEAHAATVLVSTPAHLRSLVTLPPGALGSIRVVVSSGARLLPETGRALRERFGTEVLEVLGSTETGGIARRRGDSDEPFTPLPGVTVAVGPDERLVVQSPFVGAGTESHLTADRIELLADGRFLHRGRSGSVVKVGGRRLDCAELEAQVLALPGVSDAAVLATDVDALRGVSVELAVVAPSWTAAGIRRELQRHFDGPLLPRRICLLPRLPRGEGGKLQRQELADAMAQAGSKDPSRGVPFEVERGPLRSEGDREVVTARVTVARGAAYFEGHFPGDPLLPAVAQLSALIVPEARSTWSNLGAVTAAPRLKWAAPVRPGAILTLTLARTRGSTRVDYVLAEDAEPAASGALVFSLQAAPSEVSPSP